MHPSMVYEIAFNVIAAAAIVRWGRRVPAHGDLLKVYLLAAVVFRFFVEFVRGNETFLWGLSGSQVLLLCTLPLLFAYFARQLVRGAYRPAPLEVAA